MPEEKGDQTRDEVLKRMLKTPPKSHEDLKLGKAAGRKKITLKRDPKKKTAS